MQTSLLEYNIIAVRTIIYGIILLYGITLLNGKTS
jgi:hypothetical protein